MKEVAACLVEYLSIRDVFALRVALGRDDGWLLPDVICMLEDRMRLTRRPGRTPSDLSKRMANARCHECGRPTRCRPAVCKDCTDLVMMDRAEIRRLRIHNVERFMREELVPAKRTCCGRFLYWRDEVHDILSHRTHRR